MNEAKHTPLNLSVQCQADGEPVFILGPEPENCLIARLDEGTLEDAAMIVRAVNNHAALVEALEFLLADYVAIEGARLTSSEVPQNKARAALAAARE